MAEQIITSGQRVTDSTGDPYLRSLFFWYRDYSWFYQSTSTNS